jgi:hypothetical protein
MKVKKADEEEYEDNSEEEQVSPLAPLSFV